MRKSETSLAHIEKVIGRESKVRQNEKSKTINLDPQEQKIYEDEMFEEVPTADPAEYLDDFLIKPDQEPLSIANPKTEQSNDELFRINPKILLEEVRRAVQGTDITNINPKIAQEDNASKEPKTNQIQLPKVDPGEGNLPQRIEQDKFKRKGQTKKHISPKSPLKLPAADPPKRSTEFYLLPKVINGGFAGIVGVSIIYPLDFVKTRLQTQVPGPDGQLPYKNIFDCFKKTIKTEGYFGMYRGSLVNIVFVAPEKAIKLAANDYFRYRLTRPNGELSLLRQVLAGSLAGLLQVIITTPMELLKIRMQMSGQAIAEANVARRPVTQVTPSTIMASLIKENGIFGLYKGVTVTMLRVVPFSAIYFPLFATLNEMGLKSPDGSGDILFWRTFASGVAAGAISALAMTPADVVKTRLQNTRKVKGVAPEYLGIADCFAKTLKNEGVKAFYKGGACRVMVVAPLYGITQAIYYLGFAENVFLLKNK